MLTKFIIQKGKIGTLFAILISINQRKYEKRSWSFTGRRSWSFGSIKFNKHKKILTKKDKKYSDVIRIITDTLMKKPRRRNITE
jgi:hypothetical protein